MKNYKEVIPKKVLTYLRKIEKFSESDIVEIVMMPFFEDLYGNEDSLYTMALQKKYSKKMIYELAPRAKQEWQRVRAAKEARR